jgi:anti-sigma factor RsiW
MSDAAKNILNDGDVPLNNEQLLEYLRRQLPDSESHEVEKAMAADPFVDDAVEGLQQMGNTKNIEAYTEQLNHFVQQQTKKKKERKSKRRFKDSPYSYIAVIVILLLLVLGWLVIKKMG